MTRWYKHVAVCAAWLGLGTVALAQPGQPSPVGAARMVEPLRYTPNQPPMNLEPGPVNAMSAPVGPPPSLNLPADHTNAFPQDRFPPEAAFFASVGGIGLQRQKLTRLPIGFYDVNGGGIDTQLIPLGTLASILTLSDLTPQMNLGFKVTAGWIFGSEAIELTGFYQPHSGEFRDVLSPGRVHVPFGPPGVFPIGFEGRDGLWNSADRLKVTFTNSVGNAEANYRMWSSGIATTELICGVRFFHNQERVDILTDDEFFVRDFYGKPDPLRQATYSVSSRTNHVGLQFGGEFSTPLPGGEAWSWIWLTASAKSSIGANFIERSFRLTRGDGLSAFDIHKNDVKFGSVNELAGFLDLHLLERVRFRGGYQAILGTGFSAAASQIDFNLTTQGSRKVDDGTIIWHGPVLEMQFLF